MNQIQLNVNVCNCIGRISLKRWASDTLVTTLNPFWTGHSFSQLHPKLISCSGIIKPLDVRVLTNSLPRFFVNFSTSTASRRTATMISRPLLTVCILAICRSYLNRWMNLNEWKKIITYISPVKPERQAQWWRQTGKDVGNYSTSRGVRTWRTLAQVITCDFCCFLQRAIHGAHSPCSNRNVRGELGICDARVYTVCVKHVGDRFSTRAPVQSLATAIQRRTKTRITALCEDPGYRYQVLSLPNGLSKLGERNLISAVCRLRWIRTHNFLIDIPACYHRAITALEHRDTLHLHRGTHAKFFVIVFLFFAIDCEIFYWISTPSKISIVTNSPTRFTCAFLHRTSPW